MTALALSGVVFVLFVAVVWGVLALAEWTDKAIERNKIERP